MGFLESTALGGWHYTKQLVAEEAAVVALVDRSLVVGEGILAGVVVGTCLVDQMVAFVVDPVVDTCLAGLGVDILVGLGVDIDLVDPEVDIDLVDPEVGNLADPEVDILVDLEVAFLRIVVGPVEDIALVVLLVVGPVEDIALVVLLVVGPVEDITLVVLLVVGSLLVVPGVGTDLELLGVGSLLAAVVGTILEVLLVVDILVGLDHLVCS
jgi:hypothetical protein